MTLVYAIADFLDDIERAAREYAAPLLCILIFFLVFVGRTLDRPVTPAAAAMPSVDIVVVQPRATQVPTVMATATMTTVVSIPVTSSLMLSRSILAYDAPDGRILGPIDKNSSYMLLSHQGTNWVELRVHGIGGTDGAGAAWVRTEDMLGLANVANVPAPATPAPPVPVQPKQAPMTQPAHQAPVVMASNAVNMEDQPQPVLKPQTQPKAWEPKTYAQQASTIR